MRKIPKLIFLVLASYFLSACISSKAPPRTEYYLLEDKPLVMEWESASPSMRINIVSMPSYLRQKSLVMLEQSHKLYFANYHQWAVEIGPTMEKVLIYDLNLMSNNLNYYSHCTDCSAIKIYVESFYPSEDGEVYLTGHFEVSDKKVNDDKATNTKNALMTFDIKLDQSSSGYIGSVRAMRSALTELAKNIHQEMN